MRDKRILIIDDDRDLLDMLETVLAQRGADVHVALHGQQGLDKFHARRPDLVLLDVMMPDMDGWEVCRKIREVSNVPIIMISALGRDQDVVRSLELGADDYIIKPCSPSVLVARTQAALRRSNPSFNGSRPHTYDDGYLKVDLDHRRVSVDGVPVSLSPTEYRLLAYLVEHAGRVLTFAQILESVWDHASRERMEYVHVYISYLRQKLEPDPGNPRYFLSERGVGYRFERRDRGSLR